MIRSLVCQKKKKRTNPDLRAFPTRKLNHLQPPPPTMARPHAALRQWLQLRESLSKPCLHSPRPHRTDSFARANPNSLTHHRHFHPSPPSNAQRPAPMAARARREKAADAQLVENFARSGQSDFLVDNNGIFIGTLGTYGKEQKTLEERLADFEKVYPWQYQAGTRDGFIPNGISESTFRDVGRKLLQAGYAGPPNGQAIRAISTGEFINNVTVGARKKKEVKLTGFF